MNNSIEQQIYTIVAQVTGTPVYELTKDRHFVNDLGIDSIDLAEIVSLLEGELHVDIPEEMTAKFQRVGDLVKYVIEQKSGGES